MRQALGLLVVAGMLTFAAGCHSPERRPIYQSQPVPPPSPRPVLPGAPMPPPGAISVAPPPGAISTAPAPSFGQPVPAAAPFPTSPPAPPPAAPAVPAAPPGTTGAALQPSDAIARVDHRWQPLDQRTPPAVQQGVQQGAPQAAQQSAPQGAQQGAQQSAPQSAQQSAPQGAQQGAQQSAQQGVQLGAPEPLAAADAKSPTRLYPPEGTAEPPLIKNGGTQLPVGIRQFATALDKVTAGLRPSPEDGLDWLKSHGYRTVLHVHAPGEDDAADKSQVEKHGMKYLALEASPKTLTKEVFEEFSRIVDDAAGHPLFVYDADGALAGGLWYLYFRVRLQTPHDVARVRAAALGLREDRAGMHTEMWLAVQKYLSEQAP